MYRAYIYHDYIHICIMAVKQRIMTRNPFLLIQFNTYMTFLGQCCPKWRYSMQYPPASTGNKGAAASTTKFHEVVILINLYQCEIPSIRARVVISNSFFPFQNKKKNILPFFAGSWSNCAMMLLSCS